MTYFGTKIYLVIFLLLTIFNCFVTAANSIADDIDVISARRVQDIIRTSHNPELANKWRDELTSQGNWTDIDYTHGCPANRADWKAAEHFRRIITMASLWYQDNSEEDLLTKINLAVDHWFGNDFTNVGCITGGSVERFCPCGTPGFWNPNWWYQMILMPRLVGNACLLLKAVLTEPRHAMCVIQTKRSYVRIDGDPDGTMGRMTGANLLDVTYTGLSLALLTSDNEVALDALARSYNESELTYGFQDGIKVDGSFMQHSGQLLTGSYGSVFISNMIKTFAETQNTSLEPPLSVQSAFITLIDGSEWFMYHKNETEDQFSPLVMWEYSVIGRSISHKYSDWRGIGFNLDHLINATTTWPNHEALKEIVDRLQTGQSVNPGGLVGTRYFHVTDFLVHRGLNFIVTLKMFSKRTTNSECYNAQNPYGFHLSDGSIFTYLDGNEYTDVAGAWDWYLIPGTTVDYGATPLVCNQVEYSGKEAFVGGLGHGNSGLAVMIYTNPSTASLTWTKTFFFYPNSYVVQFVGPVISANIAAPVYTTLDQRHLSGPIYIDGELLTEVKVRRVAQTFWHDRVGYEFLHPVNLTVDTSPRQSNWTAIGTSEGNETHIVMAAYFEHPREQLDDTRFTYIAHLDVSLSQFNKELQLGQRNSNSNAAPKITEVPALAAKASATVRGATFGTVGTPGRIVSLAFLTAGYYFTGLEDIQAVEVDSPILLQFQRKANNDGWVLALADPSQLLPRVVVVIHLDGTPLPVVVAAELPSGAWAGSMITREI